MKYFVTSDVHSFYDELIVALNEKGFEKDNSEHVLCVCGDLFDRGNGSRQLFEFVKELNAQGRLIYVRGNHEDLLFDCVEELKADNIPGNHHFSNGTVKTICMLCGQSEWIIYDREWRSKVIDIMNPVLEFIDKNSVNYAEIGDYILTHGWIPCDASGYGGRASTYVYKNNWRESKKLDWKFAHWYNGMEAARQGVIEPNKIIICGHWHCSYGWSHIRQERKEWPQTNRKDWQKSFEPFVDDGIVAIDACTAYSGIVNVLVIEI